MKHNKESNLKIEFYVKKQLLRDDFLNIKFKRLNSIKLTLNDYKNFFDLYEKKEVSKINYLDQIKKI